VGLEAAILKESVKAHLSSFLASIMYRGSKDSPRDKIGAWTIWSTTNAWLGILLGNSWCKPLLN